MSETGKVITANQLVNGVTVYLDSTGNWTPALAEAQLVTDAAELDRLMARVEEDVAGRVVVDPYPMDVAAGKDGPQPLSQRERIRAKGPTIRYVFS